MPKGGNPNIAKYAEGHRFGDAGGADPREAQAKGAKPWSIRNSVRRICAAEIDITRNFSQAELVKIFGKDAETISIGQLLAARKIEMAFKGSEKMMTEVTNDVDGKLIEKKVEAKTTLEDLVNGDHDDSDQEG